MSAQRAGSEGVLAPERQVAIARLRDELAPLHAELVRRGGFAATGAVLSARVPGAGLLLVSPDTFPDAALGPESLVLCDLDGVPVADTPGSALSVSREARVHGELYRRRPALGGIVRLRAPHVSAWAARAEPLPCALVALAEEFGGDIPVGPAPVADPEAYADALLAALDGTGSRALLLPGDGLLAVGDDARAAARSAALAEDAAGALLLALPHGALDRLTADEIAALAPPPLLAPPQEEPA